MSLIFVPKIPEWIKNPPPPTKSMIAKAPKTNRKPFGPVEINNIVFLRAINMSYNDMSKRLRRSPSTLAWVVHEKGLSYAIEDMREWLVADHVSKSEYFYKDVT
jgi:hypothetical protein